MWPPFFSGSSLHMAYITVRHDINPSPNSLLFVTSHVACTLCIKFHRAHVDCKDFCYRNVILGIKILGNFLLDYNSHMNCTGPCKHNSIGLVSIRCVVREMQLFSQPASSCQTVCVVMVVSDGLRSSFIWSKFLKIFLGEHAS